MCTVIVLFRPGHDWPLLLAANRDEMLDRPWLPPAPHWAGQPDVVGGRDVLAGGTWLAVNRAGVAAAVLNRSGTLGPAPGRRSRGELPLLALRAGTARDGAALIAGRDASAWRSFNMVIADAEGAVFLRGTGSGVVEASALPPGLSMVTSADPNDMTHPRVARHLPRFMAAEAPAPPDWAGWPALLADGDGAGEAALAIPPVGGFGTSSSSLLALGGAARQFLFAAGRPGEAPFAPVAWP